MFKINAIVGDIECFFVGFYFLTYHIETKKWREFEISGERNDLFPLVKYLVDRDWQYMVGYNSISYDGQLLQYIIENYNKWIDLSGEMVNREIYKFSQKVIDDTNHDLFPPYRDDRIIPQIDLFKIHHFDNEAKRCSLKWLQYMMNWKNLETIPHHHAANLGKKEWGEVKTYCKNDVLSTYEFYKYTIGEVEHSFYSGENKIQDRLDAIEEFELPSTAISWSDVKIGDELNLRSYCTLTNKTRNEVYELKKRRGPTKPFTYGSCIPQYVKFKTPELIEFKKKVEKERVSLLDTDKQQYPITFKGTTYSIMRGGIHSCEKHRIVIPKEDELLRDADVGAQYPNAIIKRELYPPHLGKQWLVGYKNSTVKKDEYKQKWKLGDKRAKGLEKMYKLSINGGGFGKKGEKNSWQYDPKGMYSCTIGNEFEILMLIEMWELAGIHCISGNTDGAVVLFKKELENTYYEICHEWERIVGNEKMGKLEYTDFAGLYQESINHYVAVKTDGKIKVKGRFSTEDELNKNNSDKISRIERKALVNYFAKGEPIEDTIRNSRNIWDFCIGKKASKDYFWQTISGDGRIEKYDKLIRFYISEDGDRLVKIKKEESEATGAKLTNFFSGQKITMFNEYVKLPFSLYSINYEYYIENISKIVNSIEKSRKNKKFIEQPKEQLKLF